MGWVFNSGSVYELDFPYPVISSIAEAGTVLTEAGSVGAIVAGSYYHDRIGRKIYLQATDSSNPNSKFEACTFKLFFSNVSVSAPWDLDSGFDVEWVAALKGTSEFGFELDNKYQFGLAIEGSGYLELLNDQNFWIPRFDKLTFENQKVFIYSWSTNLPVSEAKLLYRGRIQGKAYSADRIRFDLKDFINELRLPIALELMRDYPSARLSDSLKLAKQRLIYGYIYGHRPTNFDQILTGFAATGTVSITAGSDIVTGSGTQFLAEATPGDSIFVQVTDVRQTIGTVDSDTQITLSEPWAGDTDLSATLQIKPQSGGRKFINRQFLVAGHSLREPSTTVVTAGNTRMLQLADVSDLEPGDYLTIGSEFGTILRVSGDVVVLENSLNLIPAPATVVTRNAIQNVYLNEDLLVLTRDYTYSALNGTLTLTTLAEFNVATVEFLTGSTSFAITSRLVTGSATFFKKDVKSGDWIRSENQSDYFEVLSVESDTALTLRSASTYTEAGDTLIKRPAYYVEGQSALSCDCLGATDDGNTTGVFLKTAPQIVEDLLDRSGIPASDIISSTFDATIPVARYKIGLAIPTKYSDQSAPLYRDVIGNLNRSVFGALIQNEDFKFEYTTLFPRIPDSTTKFVEADVLEMAIETDSDRIVRQVNLTYLQKEYDPVSQRASNALSQATSKDATYLAQTTKEFDISTLLVDEDEAGIQSGRWSFLMGVASSILRMKTKMQGARFHATDKIELEHEKLYERVGSNDQRKIAGIQYVKKTAGEVTIELEDLANAFSRACTIGEPGTDDYFSVDEEEHARQGYITDSYGMMNNDPETFGKNLIW